MATALRASRPAAISTLGFEVLVQEVIAAITTSPWPTSKSRPSTGTRLFASPGFLNSPSSAAAKPCLDSASSTRSCGRFGPASDGSTLEMSSSRVSVNTGSGVDFVRHMPWALAYFSTSSTRLPLRPVSSRYSIVSESIGKKPQVAPYSGAMLAIVARSASDRLSRPGP